MRMQFPSRSSISFDIPKSLSPYLGSMCVYGIIIAVGFLLALYTA